MSVVDVVIVVWNGNVSGTSRPAARYSPIATIEASIAALRSARLCSNVSAR